MNIIIFYISIGLAEVLGLFLLTKSFFYPSQSQKGSLIKRSIISGIGGTLLVIGLMLLNFYNTSPINFWSEWSIPKFIGFSFFCGVPIILFINCCVPYLLRNFGKIPRNCKKSNEKIKRFLIS